MKYFITIILIFSSYFGFTQNFTDIETGIIPVNFSAVDFGDFDADGDQDLLVTGSSTSNTSTTKLYRNDEGIFTEVTETGFPNVTLGAVEWGDINNDGYPELLLQGYIEGDEVPITDVYLNNSDGTFTALNLDLPQVYQGGVDWADFNNDGYLDFALSGFDDAGGVYISKLYKNNQDMSFSELTGVNLEGTILGKMKWGDYNNDSYQDFVLTGFGISGFITEIWKNNGDDTFEQSDIALQLCWLGDVEWGDYNNDSFLDLFLTGDNGGTKYSILYHNNGDGTFSDSGETFNGVSHSSIEWADFDADGDLDIFIAGTADAMGTGDYLGLIYINDEGIFTENIEVSLPGSYWGDCKTTDIDNDGRIDLYINGFDETESPYSAIFINTTATNSLPENTIPISIYPNPAKNLLNVTSKNWLIERINLIDSSGKLVFSKKMSTDSETIDIKILQKGLYVVEIVTLQGKSYTKLVIE